MKKIICLIQNGVGAMIGAYHCWQTAMTELTHSLLQENTWASWPYCHCCCTLSYNIKLSNWLSAVLRYGLCWRKLQNLKCIHITVEKHTLALVDWHSNFSRHHLSYNANVASTRLLCFRDSKSVFVTNLVVACWYFAKLIFFLIWGQFGIVQFWKF